MAQHTFVAVHIDESAPEKEDAVHRMLSAPGLRARTRVCLHQQDHDGGVIIVEVDQGEEGTRASAEAAAEQLLGKVREIGLEAQRVSFL